MRRLTTVPAVVQVGAALTTPISMLHPAASFSFIGWLTLLLAGLECGHDQLHSSAWGLARLLEAWGFEVTVKHDGTSALRALDLDPAPDFVLTDWLLPDLDGREIARIPVREILP